MRSARLARRLLRLYPRAWRDRYGDEFLAVMEDTELSCQRAVDVLVAALHERVRVPVVTPAVATSGERASAFLFWTATMALLMTSLATGLAVMLRELLHAVAEIRVEDGHRFDHSPWQATLGAGGVLGQLLVMGRFTVASAKQWGARWGCSVNVTELPCWYAVILLGSIGSQWSMMVANVGSGLQLDSAPERWYRDLIPVANQIQMLHLSILLNLPGPPRLSRVRRDRLISLGLSEPEANCR